MKLGLLGGSGQLGQELRRTATAAGHAVIAPDSTTVDIRKPDQLLDWVNATQADAWINAAAYTAVDAAEDDIAGATALNVDAPRNLSNALRQARVTTPLIYFSTDYVFSGDSGAPYTETSATQPRSVYGATKLAGEQHTAAHANAIVLRISWVFGRHGHNFVKAILRAARRFAREGGALKVVDDQFGSPCSTRAISNVVLQLLVKKAQPGVYHLASTPYVNWHEFACAIVDEAVASGLLSHAVEVLTQPTGALNQKATRPPDGRLDSSKLQATLDISAPSWRDDLRTMLTELTEEELDG